METGSYPLDISQILGRGLLGAGEGRQEASEGAHFANQDYKGLLTSKMVSKWRPTHIWARQALIAQETVIKTQHTAPCVTQGVPSS